MKNLIKEIRTKELNGIKTFEIVFSNVKLNEECRDYVNESITDLFSLGIREYEKVEIDWRDPTTVEVRVVVSD